MASKRAKKMIYKLKRQAKNPEGLQVLTTNAAKMTSKMTWPEREFKKMLKELKVKFEVQKIVGSKIFDFYIPEKNLIVEVDGSYYHGNPETNKTLNGMQKKNIRNDVFKDALAKGLGYGIERVWENELKDKYEEVKKRFKKLLK